MRRILLTFHSKLTPLVNGVHSGEAKKMHSNGEDVSVISPKYRRDSVIFSKF